MHKAMLQLCHTSRHVCRADWLLFERYDLAKCSNNTVLLDA